MVVVSELIANFNTLLDHITINAYYYAGFLKMLAFPILSYRYYIGTTYFKELKNLIDSNHFIIFK